MDLNNPCWVGRSRLRSRALSYRTSKCIPPAPILTASPTTITEQAAVLNAANNFKRVIHHARGEASQLDAEPKEVATLIEDATLHTY